MDSLFDKAREEQYTLSFRIKNVYMKITEECWLTILFRLNGRDQESDSIPLDKSVVNLTEVAQILTNCSFSQTMNIKVTGADRKKATK